MRAFVPPYPGLLGPAAPALRTLSRYRRVLAALFGVAAAALALMASRSPAGPGARVLVAARDLPGGVALRPGDLRPVVLPSRAIPDGGVRSGATGRVLSGPMRRGEPLTDARLTSPGMLRGYGSGVVALPVRIADAGAARLLRPGDRVDVLAAAPAGGEVADDLASRASGELPDGLAPSAGGKVPDGLEQRSAATSGARTVAWSVPVLSVPRDRTALNDGGDGALIVLAASRSEVATLTGAAAGGRLSIAIVSGD